MAEVKVKITAQNQTQTGFQAVLADAQKTASQVQQTFARAADPGIRTFKSKELSSGPITVDIGDYGLEPLRDLQRQIRQVRESARDMLDARPAQDFNNGMGSMLGRFALLIGAAVTFGKIVASAFDRLSEAIKSATALQDQFNTSLRQAGTATSLDGAIAQFSQLSEIAKQTAKTLDETMGRSAGEAIANFLSGRPGQIFARLADAATGGAVSTGINDQADRQRAIARENLIGDLERQRLAAQAVASAGGDPAAIEAAKLKLERDRQRRQLEQTLERGGFNPQQAATARGILKETFRAQDESRAAQERLSTEKEITQEKEKQAALAERQAAQAKRDDERITEEQKRIAKARQGFDQDIALTEARLRGDKRAEDDILQQRDVARVVDAGGTFEQGANLAAANSLARRVEAAMAGSQIAGSFGASALQRIGFASNEFFDTRREDTGKNTAKISEDVKRIVEALKNPNTLVMKSEF